MASFQYYSGPALQNVKQTRKLSCYMISFDYPIKRKINSNTGCRVISDLVFFLPTLENEPKVRLDLQAKN